MTPTNNLLAHISWSQLDLGRTELVGVIDICFKLLFLKFGENVSDKVKQSKMSHCRSVFFLKAVVKNVGKDETGLDQQVI